MRIPELLAPAGSFDALVAAVENGADAVYLGGKLFSARAFADNFDLEEMTAAVRYAHLRNVRIYVTANILIDNGELVPALEYIKKLYDIDVDAVIVQDLGLAYLIRRMLPGLHVHASTQMTVHNAEGVKFLEQLGLFRVVLAREVSLAGIAEIKKQAGAELEVFGHGALCISYSGQCLMSSLIGGRSGNRGKCAQPCRLNYTLVDAEGRELSGEDTGRHLLSPRDLNTLEILPEICAAEIASLKFEGRMKRPEYVATVVRVYRKVLDRFQSNPGEFYVTEEEQKDLAQIFNRDFTTGYLLKKPGRGLMSFKRPNNRGVKLGRIEKVAKRFILIKLDDRLAEGDGVEIWVTKGGRQGFVINEILANGIRVDQAEPGETVSINYTGIPRVGDRVFKTHDIRLMEKAQNSIRYPSRLFPLNMKISARENNPITLEAWDESGNRFTYTSEYLAEKAQKHPATEESVIKQLGRLGGTAFRLGEISFDIGEGLMLPASELNAARRRVVDEIEHLRLGKYRHRPKKDFNAAKTVQSIIGTLKKRELNKFVKISVRTAGLTGARAAAEAGADIIYIGGEVFSPRNDFTDSELGEFVRFAHNRRCEVVFALPRIFHEHEKDKVYRMLDTVKEAGVDGILAGGTGGIEAAKNYSWRKPLYGDFGLNVFNNITIHVLKEAGVQRLTLSPEMTFGQIEAIGRAPIEMECIVHGPLPMMVSEYCAVGAVLGESKSGMACTGTCRTRRFGLKDRMNYIFPVETDQFCRMHIFNPKDLCLVEHLDRFTNGGIGAIRIEAVRYEPKAVSYITETYRRVRDAVNTGTLDKLDFKSITDNLGEYSPGGFTKGHYFRGVLE